MEFHRLSEYSRSNSSKWLVTVGMLLISFYAGLFVVRYLASRMDDYGGSPPLFIVFRVFLIVAGLMIFGNLAMRQRVNDMIALLILFLPVFSGAGFRWFTFYTDTIGGATALNLTSVMLLACLAVLIIQDRAWVRRAIGSPLSWLFLVLILSGLFTQIYHLGLKAGLGLTYDRVMQPAIFIVLVSYLARTKEGLERLFGCFVVSVLLAIVLRFALPGSVNLITGRVSAIGSWTIYGTILVAVLPFTICLWVTTKNPALKVLLPVSVVLAVMEVMATQTRGAIAALSALGLFVGSRISRKWVLVVVGLLVLLAFGTGWSLGSIKLSQGRQLSLNLSAVMSEPNWTGRVTRNAAAWEYIKVHPFTGLGLGKPTSESGLQMPYWVYNPYLHWGVSMGVPALLSFSLIMLLSVVWSIRNFILVTKELKIYSLSIIISLAVWLVNQFTTGDSLTYMQPVEAVFFFYAVIGMVLGQQLALGSVTPSTNSTATKPSVAALSR